MQVPPAATPPEKTVAEQLEERRFRTLVRLREAGLSDAAIRTMLPEWMGQALAGREPNTGSPR